MNYSFGQFELDSQLFRLRKGSEVIRLQPKVFSVLHYLVEHNDGISSTYGTESAGKPRAPGAGDCQ